MATKKSAEIATQKDINEKFTIIDDHVRKEDWAAGKGPYPPLQVPDPVKGFLVRPVHPDRLPGQAKARILQWFYERIPFEQIVDRVQFMGYVIDTDDLSYWAQKACREGSDVTDSVELDELRLKLEQKVVYGLLDICFAAVQNMPVPKINDVNEFEKIATATSKLVVAIAQRERVETDKAVIVNKVRDWLKKEFQRLMAGRPELVEQINELSYQVNDVIDQSAENVKKLNLGQ